MTKAKKQTAANNADLARVKAAFNAPTYKEALAIYNAEGRDACKVYIGACYNDEYRAERLAVLFPPIA